MWDWKNPITFSEQDSAVILQRGCKRKLTPTLFMKLNICRSHFGGGGGSPPSPRNAQYMTNCFVPKNGETWDNRANSWLIKEFWNLSKIEMMIFSGSVIQCQSGLMDYYCTWRGLWRQAVSQVEGSYITFQHNLFPPSTWSAHPCICICICL